MTLTVCTPTGNIGRHVVRELLDSGESVRVIVRDPGKLDAETQNRVEVVQGSLDDAALLTQAFEGAEAVFWCVPADNKQDNVLDYYLHFANAATVAIRQTATPRIVAISSGGKGLAKNAGPISALHRMEDVLNETGVAARYLRCGYFMENFLWHVGAIAQQGQFFFPFPGDLPLPMVAARDIGIKAAGWLKQRDWTGQDGIAVQGAEDLTFDQAAKVFSDVFNKPVQFQSIPPEAGRGFLLKNGCSPAFAQGYLDMCAEVANGIYRAEPRTPETTTSTTLHQWATTVMVPMLQKT